MSTFTDSAGFVLRRPPSVAVRKEDGRLVPAVTNNLQVRVRKGMSYRLYAVSCEPAFGTDEDPKVAASLTSAFMRRHMNVLKERLHSTLLLPAGFTLYALGNNGAVTNLAIDLPHPTDDQKTVNVALAQRTELTIDSGSADKFTPEQLLPFNIAVRESLRAANMSVLGRFAYDLRTSVELPAHKISVFAGYYVSLNQTEVGLALQVDVRHKILQSLFAHEKYMEMARLHGTTVSPAFRTDFERFIEKRTVMTTVGGGKKFLYKIDKVEWGFTARTVFEKKGVQVSFYDYYVSQHNIRLQEVDMPLLVSEQGKGRRICKLPLELCQITGLDEKIRTNNRAMMEVANVTRLRPDVKLGKAMKMIGDLKALPVDQGLDRYGAEIGSAFETTGREVPEERVEVITDYQEVQKMQAGQKPRGNRPNRYRFNFPHFLQKRFIGFGESQGTNFKDWMIVYFERDEGHARGLAADIKGFLEQSRIRCAPARPVAVRGTAGKDFKQALDAALTSQVMSTAKPSMVVALLPGDGKAYSDIKQYLCGAVAAKGIVSQCIKTATYQNKGEQALPKLVHQMICKMGGSLWALPISPRGVKTMVVGVDTLQSGGKIFATLTASCNPTFTKYFNTVAKLDDRGAMGTWLAGALKDACVHFRQTTSGTPSRIIVYRDGVGESQKAGLRGGEIELCLEALEKLDKMWAESLEFGFIVVNKRINQRFARKIDELDIQNAQQKRGGRGGSPAAPPKAGDLTNPLPLTVFDKGIVDPEKFDFFCVHQEVTAGTVTPTHYDVLLWKVPKMNPLELQDFTCQLSMLYQNWPGPIRVPAPVMYATKLCQLVSVHIKEKPHNDLKGSLYFL